jgi:hypothetical protein
MDATQPPTLEELNAIVKRLTVEVHQLKMSKAELRAMVVSVFQQEQEALHKRVFDTTALFEARLDAELTNMWEEVSKGQVLTRQGFEKQSERMAYLEKIVERCCEEMAGKPRKRKGDTGQFFREQTLLWAKKLALLMDQTLDMDDIRAICFEFGVDFEHLKGEEKRAKIRQMIIYFFQRKTLPLLADHLQLIRPNMQWPLTAVEATIDFGEV